MEYGLGVDLGTTFTGAAVTQDGHVEMVSLGDRAIVTPSVVFARDNGQLLTGDAAVRRAQDDPARAGREFKRRLGDPSPLMLGATLYSPAMLMGTLLSSVVDTVDELHGQRPARLVLTHPAVWGPYRREQFTQVPRLSGLDDVLIVPEPVAAATYYIASGQLHEGDVIAVYDLGGGTFDATVVRLREGRIEILGDPEGVEWLGGMDFDEAILSYVDRALDGAVGRLDRRDPQQALTLYRLQQECVLAKEALSIDDQVTIRAFLPDGLAEIPLTRAGFEALVLPALQSTVQALNRALKSAQVSPEELAAVLLVGGSSRIPLVSRLISEELRRPTVANTHPKHAVALGAALIAERAMALSGSATDAGPGSVGDRASTRPARTAVPAPPRPPQGAPADEAAGRGRRSQRPAGRGAESRPARRHRQTGRTRRPRRIMRPDRRNRSGFVVLGILVLMASIGTVTTLHGLSDAGGGASRAPSPIVTSTAGPAGGGGSPTPGASGPQSSVLPPLGRP